MSARVPDYWPLLEAYHTARERLYREIMAEAHLAPDAWVLDAGCGDAFYSRLWSDTLGPSAHIVALDRNPALLQSQTHPGQIHLCQGDLEQAGLRPAAFDAIWLCRVMHSALDPLRRLLALRRLLRRGGRFIVVENDLAHNPILGLPGDFEHRLLEARYQYLRSRSPDGASFERYFGARHLPAWLRQAGLHPVSIRTYISEDTAPMAEAVETYWRVFLAWQGERIGPFLSPEDRQAYARAFDPASPDNLLKRPGFHCLELTTVACGIAP